LKKEKQMRFTEQLGAALKVLRTERGLKQADVERLAKLGHGQMSRYETASKHPATDTLARVLEALDVGTEELMETMLRVEAAGGLPEGRRPVVPRRRRMFITLEVGEVSDLEELVDVGKQAAGVEVVADVLRTILDPDAPRRQRQLSPQTGHDPLKTQQTSH
jgi:transcriptional regulator with XRE-family HTH domain